MPSSEYPFLTVIREPLPEDAVAGLEASVGYPLPSDYRRFLLRTNGGWSEWGFAPPGYREDCTPWCHFYGVHTRSRWENLAARHHHSGEVLDDESLLLVGDCEFAFLALRPDDSRVYYVDRLTNERRDGLLVLSATEFAGSFHDLCAKLHPPERSSFDLSLPGRADPHPLRKLLKQSLTPTTLREIASYDYGQDVEENLVAMRSLLDDGPGNVRYVGEDSWECWLLGQHAGDDEPDANLIRLFTAFGLLGDAALHDWTYVENNDPSWIVQRLTSAAKALGRAWHEPAVLFLRWSASLAPPYVDKSPWRDAIRTLGH